MFAARDNKSADREIDEAKKKVEQITLNKSPYAQRSIVEVECFVLFLSLFV
jgi:hypothetical protein